MGNPAQTGLSTDASVLGRCIAGSPIVFATGNKVEVETDFSSRGQFGSSLTRTYNNYWDGIGVFGKKWLSNFDYKLQFTTTSSTGTCYPRPGGVCATAPTNITTLWSLRPDGRQIKYIYNATQGAWLEDKPSPIAMILRGTDGSYTLYGEDHNVERYSATGYVLSVATEQGIGWTFTYDASNYLQRVTHTSGRYVQLTWTGNQLTRVTDPQGNQFNYTYLANRFGSGLNLLATTILPAASPTTISYYYEDSRFLGALTGKAYNGSRYSTLTYDAAGRAISSHTGSGVMDKYTYAYTAGTGSMSVLETTPLGRQTTYVFVNGRISTITGLSGRNAPSSYRDITYDANGNADKVKDFSGNVTDYDYAANGQLLQKVEAYGTSVARTTVYQWDPDPTLNRLVKITLTGVNETSFTYDSMARLASMSVKNISPYGVFNQVHTTTYSYTTYANGIINTLTKDGPLAGTGDAIVSTYSASGDLVSVQNSLGQTITYSTYNGLGEPGRIVGINGAITDYTYDAQGRTVNVRTYPNGVAADLASGYDALGLLATITSPDGVVKHFAYDVTRRVIKTWSDANGTVSNGASTQEQDFYYDSMGDIAETANVELVGQWQQGPCTQWKTVEGMQECSAWGPDVWVLVPTTKQTALSYYDGLGRLWQVSGNNGQNFVTWYDANDNPTSKCDASQHCTTLSYDALNRLIKSVDANGGITLLSYDVAGNIIKITDPRGLATTYIYDGFGQKWAQSSPDSGVESFTFDGYGQLSKTTLASGKAVTYTYDGLGRTTTATGGGQTQTALYDTCTYGKGQLCRLTDPSGQLDFTYLPEGHVQTQTQVIGTDPLSIVTGYSYNAMGEVTGISYPGGASVGYGYASGKITTMTATVNGATSVVAGTINYEPYGGPNSFSYGNNLVRNFRYDMDGRLTDLSTTNGSTYVQHLSFGFDANDQITGITNATNTAQTQSYAYDALIRLTGVTSVGGNWTFGLDASTNRSSHVGPSGTVGYTLDASSNRLLGTTGASVRSFGYDTDGNRAADTGANGTLGFTYDPFNRMSSATKNNVTTNYLVNAFGQRVRKDRGTAATTTGYVYGPGNRMLGEYNWSGSGWTNYLWLGGKLVGIVRNNTLYYVMGDHLGRPEIVTNASRAIVWLANNEAFSRTVTIDAIGGVNLGFPGQYYDAETGLWNNGFRDYDASVGRYLETDPVGLAGGINPYAYVLASPVRFADPYGLVGAEYDSLVWLGELGRITHEPPSIGTLLIVDFYGGYLLGMAINAGINHQMSQASGYETSIGSWIYDRVNPDNPKPADPIKDDKGGRGGEGGRGANRSGGYVNGSIGFSGATGGVVTVGPVKQM